MLSLVEVKEQEKPHGVCKLAGDNASVSNLDIKLIAGYSSVSKAELWKGGRRSKGAHLGHKVTFREVRAMRDALKRVSWRLNR